MTDISPPKVIVSLDELGMVKSYRDDSMLDGSKIVKGNYLYSAHLCYNENTDKVELVVSKYDLSVKLLVSLAVIDLTQKYESLLKCYELGVVNVKWLTPSPNDRLELIITFARRGQMSNPTCNLLCVTKIVKLKESDFSVIDILERQIDVVPNKGTFISMTFGKAKLKPENWFTAIRLAPSDLVVHPSLDQFRATFNVRMSNGRTYVGGFNEGVGNPVWFAISCCNYFDTRLYANLTCNNHYFGWGMKHYKGNNIGRLYAVDFGESFSTVELKYTDTRDNSDFIPSRWLRCTNYSLSCRRSIVCEEACPISKPTTIMVFSDKDVAVYKIPTKDIAGDNHAKSILWNFYHDPSNDFIYFVCYEFSGPNAVLGYINFDHDNKTANVYYTNLIEANVNYSSRLGYKAVVNRYMCPEYIYLTNDFIQDSRCIILFPVQWLYDNIAESKTIAAEVYEFDKKEVYKAQEIRA
jgi:hypothetical protein